MSRRTRGDVKKWREQWEDKGNDYSDEEDDKQLTLGEVNYLKEL